MNDFSAERGLVEWSHVRVAVVVVIVCGGPLASRGEGQVSPGLAWSLIT